MTIELKPCPFCGSTETHIADDLVVFGGACLNCGSTSSVSSYESGAAEEWNRRAELADAQAEIAKLRGALETLETGAHYVFNNPPGECPQIARDVIEWYAGSIRSVLDTK